MPTDAPRPVPGLRGLNLPLGDPFADKLGGLFCGLLTAFGKVRTSCSVNPASLR